LWAIATGAAEIAVAGRLRREVPGEVLLLAAGVASVLLGIAVFFVPSTSAVGLVLLFGLYGLVFGASLLGQAFRLRRSVHRVGGGGRHFRHKPRAA